MTQLETIPSGRRNIYRRTDTDAKGKIIFQKEACVTVLHSKKFGTDYFSVLTTDGHSVLEAHHYVNETMLDLGRSVNSRRKSAEVIAKFTAFLELMGLPMNCLDADDVTRLTTFLRGTGKTECSNATVNGYLGALREYLSSNQISCEPLFRRHLVTQTKVEQNDFKITGTMMKFDANLPVDSHRQEEVPKYISKDDYVNLINTARSHNDRDGIMLMHLMFRYGMRLGECLGLIEEDFTHFRIGKEDVPTLVVRNRLTDAPFQHAKRKLSPRTKSDYEGASYIAQWRDDSYSHYYLTEGEDFERAFVKFMEDTRSRCESECRDNYKSSEADIVHPETFNEKGLKKNHYIFVNRFGKPLSAQLWGLRLKLYFRETGIKVDKEKKINNLSHRFRHGFAMMHARYMDPPVPVHELQKMMHHRNIASTLVYYNATQEDEYAYKTKLQERYYNNNPELKRILDDFLDDE